MITPELSTIGVNRVIDSDLSMDFVLRNLLEYFYDNFLVCKDVTAEKHSWGGALTEKPQDLVIVL